LRSTVWTSEEVPALRRYIAEIDNLRAAVHYAVSIDQIHEACVVIHGLAFPRVLPVDVRDRRLD